MSKFIKLFTLNMCSWSYINTMVIHKQLHWSSALPDLLLSLVLWSIYFPPSERTFTSSIISNHNVPHLQLMRGFSFHGEKRLNEMSMLSSLPSQSANLPFACIHRLCLSFFFSGWTLCFWEDWPFPRGPGSSTTLIKDWALHILTHSSASSDFA